jgi:hypothetical protein
MKMFNPNNREEERKRNRKERERQDGTIQEWRRILGRKRACVRVMTSYAPVPRVTMYIMFSEWSGVGEQCVFVKVLLFN